jgi:Cys-rich repeat protein
VSARRFHGSAALAALAALALAAASCHGDIRFDELSTCSTDPDCILSSMHCNSGTCVACTMDAHCTAPGYPRCDLALHRCVECGVATDCGSGGVCRAGRCATSCTTSATCPLSANICDDSICAQCDDGKGCAGSPAGPICFDHFCGACKDDTTCSGATPRCDPVTRDCVQCRTNADCPSGRPLCDVAVGSCAALP